MWVGVTGYPQELNLNPPKNQSTVKYIRPGGNKRPCWAGIKIKIKSSSCVNICIVNT